MKPVTPGDSAQQLSLERSLSRYGDLGVFIARDQSQRIFMGVRSSARTLDQHLFIEIDHLTKLELERGLVEPATVVTERGIGLVFEALVSAKCLADRPPERGDPQAGRHAGVPAQGRRAGASADYMDPKQFADHVRAESARWAQVVKASKIEAD